MIYVSFQWILIASSYDQGTLSHLKHQRRWRMRLKTSLLKEPKHILYCIHSHILCMYSYTCLHWTCVSCLSRVYTDYSSYFAVMMMFGAHTLGHKNIFGSFTNLLRVSWKCDQKYTYNNLNFSAVKVTFAMWHILWVIMIDNVTLIGHEHYSVKVWGAQRGSLTWSSQESHLKPFQSSHS